MKVSPSWKTLYLLLPAAGNYQSRFLWTTFWAGGILDHHGRWSGLWNRVKLEFSFHILATILLHPLGTRFRTLFFQVPWLGGREGIGWGWDIDLFPVHSYSDEEVLSSGICLMPHKAMILKLNFTGLSKYPWEWSCSCIPLRSRSSCLHLAEWVLT